MVKIKEKPTKQDGSSRSSLQDSILRPLVHENAGPVLLYCEHFHVAQDKMHEIHPTVQSSVNHTWYTIDAFAEAFYDQDRDYHIYVRTCVCLLFMSFYTKRG